MKGLSVTNFPLRTRLLDLWINAGTACLFIFAMTIVAPWEVIRMMWQYYPIVVVMLTGAVLRIPHLFAPMWYDEQFSLIVSRLPFDRLLLATSGDVHPPLSYLVMAPWAVVGPDWLVRVPSYIFSLLAILLFYVAMRELSIPRREATIAAMFMAVSPFQLYYANEARMYALLQFLVLLALVAGLKREWWLMALAGIGAAYSQNYGTIYMLTVATVLLIRCPRDWCKVAAVGLIVFIAWLPWLSVIRSQTSYMTNTGYWIPPATMGRVVQSLYNLITGTGTVIKFAGAGIFAACLWVVSALLWMIKRRPPSWVLVLVLTFMPVAVAVVVSNISLPILIPRPLIAISPWLYLVLVYPASEFLLLERKYKLMAFIFILPLLAVGIAGYMFRGHELRADTGSEKIMAYIKDNWQAGDVIYHEQDGSGVYFKAFAPNVPQVSYMPCYRVGAYLSDKTRRAMGMVSLAPEDVKAKRIWLIVYRFPYTPQCEIDDIDRFSLTGSLMLTVYDTNANSNYFDGSLYLISNTGN